MEFVPGSFPSPCIEVYQGVRRARGRPGWRFVHAIRSALQFNVPTGSSIKIIIDAINAHGDDADIQITYENRNCMGELFHEFKLFLDDGAFRQRVSVGIIADGQITVFIRDY